jgi:hypothetical protein
MTACEASFNNQCSFPKASKNRYMNSAEAFHNHDGRARSCWRRCRIRGYLPFEHGTGRPLETVNFEIYVVGDLLATDNVWYD